jgi:hypothetical protein
MMKRAFGAANGLAVALVAAAAASAAPAGDANPAPDFVGPWLNDNAFMLIPAASGPKPIGDLPGYVHHERGVDAQGRDYSTNAYIGDYKSPLLTAWGSQTMQKEAEAAIKGKDPFWPATDCYPFGPTALLQPQPVFFVQTKDRVTIIYERDHQVRHVYLGVPHSKNPKPSWYGESVGHYDGDTLVIDTIGFNGKSRVDRYGTPYSEQLHMVERYRISPDGKSLIGEVTYDDPKAFTTQWSAVTKYHRGGAALAEFACAENPVDPVSGKLDPIPIAQKPDF